MILLLLYFRKSARIAYVGVTRKEKMAKTFYFVRKE